MEFLPLPLQFPLVSDLFLKPFCGLFLKRLANLEVEMPQMFLLAKSLYVILFFIAYLGSDLHEFQWLRVFKVQELVKVSDRTVFYLHYLSVVWNTVEDAVLLS